MYPKVYNVHGEPKSWDWLVLKYQGLLYATAHDRVAEEGFTSFFKLIAVRETIGPITAVARVYGPEGDPLQGIEVGFYWPGLPKNEQIKPIGPRPWQSYVCAQQSTDSNGHTGFGMSKDSIIGPGGGPHWLWVMHPDIPSDALGRFGWLGGTNHAGPFSLDFQLQPVLVDPDPPPVTPPSKVYAVTFTTGDGSLTISGKLTVEESAE
jgi:hypothetical protein